MSSRGTPLPLGAVGLSPKLRPRSGACRHSGLLLQARVSESSGRHKAPRTAPVLAVEEGVVSGMDVIVERVAGLDVHKETVMAALRAPDEQGGRR